MPEGLIYLIVGLLVLFVLCWLGWYVVTHLPPPMQPVAQVIFVVIAVIVLLIVVLNYGIPLMTGPHHALTR